MYLLSVETWKTTLSAIVDICVVDISKTESAVGDVQKMFLVCSFSAFIKVAFSQSSYKTNITTKITWLAIDPLKAALVKGCSGPQISSI